MNGRLRQAEEALKNLRSGRYEHGRRVESVRVYTWDPALHGHDHSKVQCYTIYGTRLPHGHVLDVFLARDRQGVQHLTVWEDTLGPERGTVKETVMLMSLPVDAFWGARVLFQDDTLITVPGVPE